MTQLSEIRAPVPQAAAAPTVPAHRPHPAFVAFFERIVTRLFWFVVLLVVISFIASPGALKEKAARFAYMQDGIDLQESVAPVPVQPTEVKIEPLPVASIPAPIQKIAAPVEVAKPVPVIKKAVRVKARIARAINPAPQVQAKVEEPVILGAPPQALGTLTETRLVNPDLDMGVFSGRLTGE